MMLEKDNYVYKTMPYAHQRKVFNESRNRVYYALLMDMGTGKSKIIIDTAAYLYGQGLITSLHIIAPNGVTRAWVSEQIIEHMPEYISYRAAYWVNSPNKQQKNALNALWQPDILSILVMNIEALSTIRGKVYSKKFVQSTNCLMVIDESHDIKTPGSKRTKAAISIGAYAKYRRILTGTSITQGPFDLYTQFKFLHPDILGHTTYRGFKHTYADLIQRENRVASAAAGRTVTYEEVINYKNLDKLRALIRPHSAIIKKEDCLDLPDKIFQIRSVELSVNQRRMYKEMQAQAVTLISATPGLPAEVLAMHPDDQLLWLMTDDTIGKVLAVNGGVKQMRLQQIIGGYVPDNNGRAVPIDKTNPRINEMIDVIRGLTGKIIIWARFRAELAAITAAIANHFSKDKAVEYHGGIVGDKREANMVAFTKGDARFFIANPQAGGVGLNLTVATNVVYYSNDYSLKHRLQSEDRCHRIGQQYNVLYVDLQAINTIDTKIMKVLKQKQKIAELIL